MQNIEFKAQFSKGGQKLKVIGRVDKKFKVERTFEGDWVKAYHTMLKGFLKNGLR